MRALWVFVIGLALAAAGELIYARAMAATPCDPREPPPGSAGEPTVMTAQTTACTHLTMRAGSLRLAALVLGSSAVAVGSTPFLTRRWRAGPIGLILAASAFPAFMLFLLRAWDPGCGAIESYVGDCTHPLWILAPALVAAIASVALVLREVRRPA